MSKDEISDEGRRERLARWEELGLDRVKADLVNNSGREFIGSGEADLKLAWKWVHEKEQAPMPAKRDMDMIRGLLLEIEGGAKTFLITRLGQPSLGGGRALAGRAARRRRGAGSWL